MNHGQEGSKILVRSDVQKTPGCAVGSEAGGHSALHEAGEPVQAFQTEAVLFRISAWDYQDFALHVQGHGQGDASGPVSDLRDEAERREVC